MKKILRICTIIGLTIALFFVFKVCFDHRNIRSELSSFLELARSHSWGKTLQVRPRVSWTMVAHAGGGVAGLSYTNSQEALDSNYAKGHRVFELDFERTIDGAVVLLHDWEGSWSRLHSIDTAGGRRDLHQFISTPMIRGLHPLTWSGLASWMREHPDAWIVTDVKDDNIAVLKEIAKQSDLVPRIIPQIYHFNEFIPVRQMGYERIFLTLYRSNYRPWAVQWFCRSHPVTAIVCWPERARGNGLALRLQKSGIPVFVHTVNDQDSVMAYRRIGVFGVYSDILPQPGN